jgi:hypothetical protein
MSSAVCSIKKIYPGRNYSGIFKLVFLLLQQANIYYCCLLMVNHCACPFKLNALTGFATKIRTMHLQKFCRNRE